VTPPLPHEFGGRTALTKPGAHTEVSAGSSAEREKGEVWERGCFELPRAESHRAVAEERREGKAAT